MPFLLNITKHFSTLEIITAREITAGAPDYSFYFDDAQILDPTYFPGEEDNSSGSVLLTVSGNNNGCFDEEVVLVRVIAKIWGCTYLNP